MRPNPQFLVDLVTFTEEVLNGKLHSLCNVSCLNSKRLKFGVQKSGRYSDKYLTVFIPYLLFLSFCKTHGKTSHIFTHLVWQYIKCLCKSQYKILQGNSRETYLSLKILKILFYQIVIISIILSNTNHFDYHTITEHQTMYKVSKILSNKNC